MALSQKDMEEQIIISSFECLYIYLFYYIIKRNNLRNTNSKNEEMINYEKIINLIEFAIFQSTTNLRDFSFPEISNEIPFLLKK